MQVHPYTYRNENAFLHLDFHQDPYQEYEFWVQKMGVDGLFTDFPGSLHIYQEMTSPLQPKDSSDDGNATSLLHKIALMVSSYKVWGGDNPTPVSENLRFINNAMFFVHYYLHLASFPPVT